jgi:hypothetical protein
MSWMPGTLRPFTIVSTRKRPNQTSSKTITTEGLIPAPYDRILCQLIAEDSHGDFDDSHEASRRQTYARQVLDMFAKEYKAYKGPPIAFRSTVLTPILQRHLAGVPDEYLPAVSKAIGDGADSPSIGQATQFYLAEDPTDPALVPAYRYNMVFIPQVRWHLGLIIKAIAIGDSSAYDRIFVNQDTLMSALKKDPNDGADERQIPRLNAAMVAVVIDEKLDIFFGPELSVVVCTPTPSYMTFLIVWNSSPSWPERFAKFLAVKKTLMRTLNRTRVWEQIYLSRFT